MQTTTLTPARFRHSLPLDPQARPPVVLARAVRAIDGIGPHGGLDGHGSELAERVLRWKRRMGLDGGE